MTKSVMSGLAELSCISCYADILLSVVLTIGKSYKKSNSADINSMVKSFISLEFSNISFAEEDWGKVSEDAKNLIKKMLTFNPTERITAREALNDKWIQNNAAQGSINQKTLKNLADFSTRNKLKQAILTFIVTQMTSTAEKEELQRTFQSLDKDGNGVLTKEELVEGERIFKARFLTLQSQDIKRSLLIRKSRLILKLQESLKKLISTIPDTSILQVNSRNFQGKKLIFSIEFVVAAMNREKLLSSKKLEQAFSMFDQDGDGFITRAELANVMGGIELDDSQWRALVEEVDTNKDGKVTSLFDEFSHPFFVDFPR